MGGASHRASSGRAKGVGPMRLMGPPPADAADADGPLMEVVAPSAIEGGGCILFPEYGVALASTNECGLRLWRCQLFPPLRC